jgi:phenylacetate-coenzyme A ligase PaaK-like adenylate-forming protein
MTDPLRWPIERMRALQGERLRETLALCAAGHPYYRRVWAEAGVDAGRVRGIEDLAALPLTDKSALMTEPEAFRLRAEGLPLHERTLWDVIYTTGSTAAPTPVYNTTHDYHAYLFQSRRVAEISGIRDTDVIANLFPLTPAPMGAFVRSAANAYASGAAIFAVLPGAPHGSFDLQRGLDEGIRLVERHRATILWGVPSYVRRLLVRAAELRADFSAVRMGVVSGETSTPAMRDELRRCLRAAGAAGHAVFDRYGSTEMGAFAQCVEDGDWHNPAPEIQYHEVIDAATGSVLPDGARGLLAITHLHRRGTVLLRFVIGDEVALTRAPCPHCGRTSERIVGPVVRAKDLVKVKGMLVNPAVLLDAIRAVEGVDEFQAIVQRTDERDPFSMDELVVRVSTAAGDRTALAERIAERAHAAVRVTPRVEFASAREIYDAERQTKAVRFVDRRRL